MEIVRAPKEIYSRKKVSDLRDTLNIPEIQRVVSMERVDMIFDSIFKDFQEMKEFLVPGVFIVAKHGDTFYLLDGQHRFTAYLRLYDEHFYDTEVVVNYISVSRLDELVPLFNRINNTVPAAEIPKSLDTKCYQKIMRYFTGMYPSIFSHSQSGSCHRPFIHKTKFEEFIIGQLNIHGDELLQKLIKLNKTLQTYNIEQFKILKNDKIEKLDGFRVKAVKKGGCLFGMFPNLYVLAGKL